MHNHGELIDPIESAVGHKIHTREAVSQSQCLADCYTNTRRVKLCL